MDTLITVWFLGDLWMSALKLLFDALPYPKTDQDSHLKGK